MGIIEIRVNVHNARKTRTKVAKDSTAHFNNSHAPNGRIWIL